MKKLLQRLALTLGLVSPMLLAVPVRAASSVVYNNTPTSWAGNTPSIGYEATSTKEFGGLVQLAGVVRTNPKVTVLMSSWACESGNWYTVGTCQTTPGAKFNHPITLNVYNFNPDKSLGAQIKSVTKTFAIDYRPSSSPECTEGRWFDGTECFNGKHVPLMFDLSGTVLPEKVAITVAYNTTHYGANPIGQAAACFSTSQGCGYDSLNVATFDNATVGSYVDPDGVYADSTYDEMYCEDGAVGVLRFTTSAGCWAGYQPAFKVEAEFVPTNAEQCKKDGWKVYGVFKNQGDCVSFVATGGRNKPANASALRF